MKNLILALHVICEAERHTSLNTAKLQLSSYQIVLYFLSSIYKTKAELSMNSAFYPINKLNKSKRIICICTTFYTHRHTSTPGRQMCKSYIPQQPKVRATNLLVCSIIFKENAWGWSRL